ncbi:hypothetical protein Tco_0383393 [Tanacetum coccineum]
MEILLEPTSNKLMVEHAEFDESNTHVLERFYTSAGNPVKEILLKLNLPDHRKLKDGGEDVLDRGLQIGYQSGLPLEYLGSRFYDRNEEDTFEGFSVSNTEGLHKGYDRFQSLLIQLEIHGAGVSTKDANQKFLRSIPSAWSQMSFESDVKGSTASSSSPQNVAFVSENTNSTNEVSTTYCVPNPSGQNLQHEQTSSIPYLLINKLPLLDHEELENRLINRP